MSNLIEAWSDALLLLLRGSQDRRYGVHGRVAFRANEIEDTSTMRRAILEVDAQQPWSDSHLHPDANAASIFYISDEPTVQEREPNGPRYYWFSIFPGTRNLRRKQVYAYEQYLEALAVSLAKKQIPHVTGVYVVLEVLSASDTFTAT